MNQQIDYGRIERELDRAEINETLSAAIQRTTADAKRLCESFGEKLEFLQHRHALLEEMEQLEKDHDLPMKALRQRVELLRQVAEFGPHCVGQTNAELKERIHLIETVKRLEPNGQASLRSLRERSRLLREIESSSESGPVEDLTAARTAIVEHISRRAAELTPHRKD
jgi:hypothetical protein